MRDLVPTSLAWASTLEPPIIGSAAPDAITLGREYDPGCRRIGGRLRYGGPRHALVFGPNETGKGVRCLVPNLLQCRGKSLFVIDPKGELAAITAPYRRTLGRVVIINPFGVLIDIPNYEDLDSAGFNPLAALDHKAKSFNAAASLLADALIRIEGKDPHWDSSARSLLAALIMYTVKEAREPEIHAIDPLTGAPFVARPTVPTMARVRELLCMDSEEPTKANGFKGRGLPALALQMMRSDLPGLRNKAAQFVDWTNETRSIASAAKRQTEPFDDLEIAEDMAKDGFDFRDMKERPVTVYVILPPEMMERHSKWLRLVLTAAIQGVLRLRRPGEPKTLFMLDEFAALGHLEIIETVWALVRGYGIQIMPVFQDMTQLKTLYAERWETFVSNAGVVASFGPNDLTTADWLSKRAGDTTEAVASYSSGSSVNTSAQGGGTTTSKNLSFSQMKVPLLDPHRLFGMRDGAMIASIAGLADIVPAYAPGYWEIAQCRERARANPYHEAPVWEDGAEQQTLASAVATLRLAGPGGGFRSLIGGLLKRRSRIRA